MPPSDRIGIAYVACSAPNGTCLETSSWTGVKDATPTVALLPTGGAEQHGPHAPVGTDTIIAQELASEAGRRSDLNSTVLPTIPVGIVPYHSHFPGTLPVSVEALRRYSYEILISLSNSNVETVVFVSGHSGNGETLRNLTRTVVDDSTVDLEVFLWEWMSAVDDHVNHAGELEASMHLHICSGEVGSPTDGDVATWDDTVDGDVVNQFTEELGKNGVVGGATSTSAEQGEQLFETATDTLCSLLRWVDDLWVPSVEPSGTDSLEANVQGTSATELVSVVTVALLRTDGEYRYTSENAKNLVSFCTLASRTRVISD